MPGDLQVIYLQHLRLASPFEVLRTALWAPDLAQIRDVLRHRLAVGR